MRGEIRCGLNAGARKHQHLRIDIDVELLQDGRKIAPAVGRVVELGLAALELLFQARDAVRDWSRVLNGRIIQRNVEGIFQSFGQEHNATAKSAARPQTSATRIRCYFTFSVA